MTRTQTPKTSPVTPTPGPRRAWWVAGAAGLVIVVTGASQGMPGLLTVPLRQEFGLSYGVIGAAFAINLVLYGVTAPFAAALMDRLGIRMVVVGALVMLAAGAALTAAMTGPWQLVIGWGVFVGLGTGALALTFAAAVTNRWFVTRRGLVSGALTSASMLGGMVLLPPLAHVVGNVGWRPAVVAVGVCALLLVPVAWLLVRDHPADVGAMAHGAVTFVAKPPPRTGATRRALVLLLGSARTGSFWLLLATYGICGASTTGIMMTHFVPAAHEAGITITLAASLLAMMGVCNVVGATGSGWLTDRVDPRWLLATCYGLRGLSLSFLPLLFAPSVQLPMVVFIVGYGLLDLATVPPTLRLCEEFYGEADATVIFGWVSAAHQLGAGAAAFAGGAARGALGSYGPVWVGAAVLCAVAMLVSLMIGRTSTTRVTNCPTAPARASPSAAGTT